MKRPARWTKKEAPHDERDARMEELDALIAAGEGNVITPEGRELLRRWKAKTLRAKRGKL